MKHNLLQGESTPTNDVVGTAVPTEMASPNRLTKERAHLREKDTLLTPTMAAQASDHSTDLQIDLIGRTLNALLAALREQRQSLGDGRERKAEDGHDLVFLHQAEEVSGYSSRQLSRLIKRGTIPNYGSRYRPKVAVGDLPRKAGMARSR